MANDAASPERSSTEWRNEQAFAALTEDGQLRAWGSPAAGGLLNEEAAALTGVRQIYSTSSAFAALTETGKVVSWGHSSKGGQNSFADEDLRVGIRNISSTKEAFAAIDLNGGVTTWGEARLGGDSRDVASELREGVVDVYSTDGSFAALKEDGRVIVWGDEFSGGKRGKSGIDIATNVKSIKATAGAFAAIRDDDTVVTWGYWNYGGVPEGQAIAALASGQVKDIYSNEFTFSALMKDGSVVCWGGQYSGGDIDPVEDELKNIDKIVGDRNAFAAISKTGKVVSWGLSGSNYDEVVDQLESGVIDIVASDQAFAAIKQDGSVVTWGSSQYGADSSEVADQLSRGVVDITATEAAFAARKKDGSVVTWGDPLTGANSSEVSQQLSSGVKEVYANKYAFTALKEDGTVVSWGNPETGGDTKYASGGELQNIVSLADVFTDDFIGSGFKTIEETPLVLEGGLVTGVDRILLIFNKELNDTRPAASRLKVLVDNKRIKVASFEVDNDDEKTAILRLKKSIAAYATVSLDYKDLAGNQKRKVIEDIHGNDLPTFKRYEIHNGYNIIPEDVDTEAPVFQRSRFNGDTISLDSNEELSAANVNKNRFKVTIDGKRKKVLSVSFSDYVDELVSLFNGSVNLGLRKEVDPDSTVRISYKASKRDRKKGALEDLAGNDMETFRSFPAEYVAVDSGPSLRPSTPEYQLGDTTGVNTLLTGTQGLPIA